MSGWRDSAACTGTDPDIFFPKNSGSKTWTRAREVCSNCPVSDECLDEAMRLEGEGASVEIRHGMFGGLTPEERKTLDSFRLDLAVAS